MKDELKEIGIGDFRCRLQTATNLIFICVISLIVFLNSCTSNEMLLKNKIDFLVNNLEESELSKLYGFSSCYSYRGFDNNGNKIIKDIVYVDKLNNAYTLPSIQNEKIIEYDLSSFYRHFDKTEQEGNVFIKLISQQIVDIITKYDLYAITSSSIELSMAFHISEGVTVSFVKDNNNINNYYRNLLKNSYLLKPNWYLLNTTEESRRIIKLFKSN